MWLTSNSVCELQFNYFASEPRCHITGSGGNENRWAKPALCLLETDARLSLEKQSLGKTVCRAPCSDPELGLMSPVLLPVPPLQEAGGMQGEESHRFSLILQQELQTCYDHSRVCGVSYCVCVSLQPPGVKGLEKRLRCLSGSDFQKVLHFAVILLPSHRVPLLS